MKTLLFFLAFFLLTNSNAQQKAIATKNASGDLIGIVTKADFNQQPYATWFAENFDSYAVNTTIVKALQKKLKGITIKAFMGTWCKDSKRETPRFYKILEAANFDFKKLEMITVNRGKTTPDNLQESFKIKRVPTFIFYKNGKEIGRYVEFPRASLEKDILTILSGKPYKHSYEK